jgi:hypothetical protein
MDHSQGYTLHVTATQVCRQMNSNSGFQCPCNEYRACLNPRGPHIRNNATSLQNWAWCTSDTLSHHRHSSDLIGMMNHSKETAVNVQYKPEHVGRDSSVGIAARYRLDGPGIESRWGRDFPHPSRPALGSTQHPIQRVPSLFPGGKAAGEWRWPFTRI